ncbi:MAG: hydantoinase/oxoprolinase family protein [Acidimicrobiaceae bacterium]|nr:hydantoinase/oxoprolinase family protein [Acidimicrobiaceae bacterium]
MADWRLAVDIGGTFTDVVLLDAQTGRIVVDKTLTTPAAPLEGVRTGLTQLLDRADVRPQDITAPIVHATTLITNALIEGKTGRAALVTTQGFGDTLLIRDEHRYDMYDLQIEFPPPPIPRELTFELNERTIADGSIATEPSTEDLEELTRQLRDAEVESAAVCLLNSYVNAANEQRVASHLRQTLGIPVCISAEISPQIREYPRMTTTACNAATMPVIGPYLDELQKWLSDEGFGGSVLMMLSNGGVVSAGDAARGPIRLVESGPAAGALAGGWFAKRLGVERLLCFDMGGTTAKACLIEHGEPELTNTFEVARAYRFKKGSGYPVSVPSVDLVEIGAGGGSLARVDQFGLLKVGPESAGADPGPASYAQGGAVPAVTDADVILGLLDPGAFLGGDMPLDASLADTATRTVAEELTLSMIDTAAGIHDVVNQNMAAAASMHGVEMGMDLRGIPIIAFGGAGPVHACAVAELLESDKVIFPVNASVLSAFGTLVSPVRIDLARSMPRLIKSVDSAEREHLLDELRGEGRRVLRAAGVPGDAVVYRYGVDARYAGQGNEITVWVGEGSSWPADQAQVVEAFEAEYRRIYGMTIPDVEVEAITWRLSALAPGVAGAAEAGAGSTPGALLAPGAAGAAEAAVEPTPGALSSPGVTGAAEAAPVPNRSRPVVFGRGVAAVDTPVYDRSELAVGAGFNGPAVVEERETTSVIRPGWSVEVAPDRSLIATRMQP